MATGSNVGAAMKILTHILLLLALPAIGQSFTTRFPTNAPTVGFQFVPAYTNLSWAGAYPPEATVVHDGVPYIVSKTSRVTAVTNLNSTVRTLFIDNLIRGFYQNDSGMPGLIFHPDGKRVFTFSAEVRYLTNGSSVTTNIVDVLRKWTIDPTNRFRVLPGGEVILEIADRSQEHLGGAMAWDSRTNLLVTLSDEGQQDGSLGNTQRIDKDFFSGVIRIDVDGHPGNLAPNPHPSIRGTYWVPSDNPWVGATNFNGQPVDPAKVRTEFYAVGLRNPHSMVKDSVTGRIFIGDVGNHRWESIFELQRGANYGWNWKEGPENTTFASAPALTNRPAVQFTAPFVTYPHAAVARTIGVDGRYSGECVFVGLVYHGSRYPSLDGKLIASDYNGNVWAITITGPTTMEWIANHPTVATSWFVDPFSGDIMASSFYGQSISRMIPASYTQPIPATLTETGVFLDVAAMAVQPEVLPYNVSNPFWSDGAHKERWFWLPPGGYVSRDSSDNWTFPAGTFWMKHFVVGSRLETRFLVKTSSGAYGLTYKWRPDGSDADLAQSTGESLALASGQPWRLPAWNECSQCHNAASGAAGFSTRQLNTTIEVDGVGPVNQLEELSARGLIYPPILSGLTQPVLSRPGDTNFSLAHRFKSYTDANCGYCHYPGGPGRGDWDARFLTPIDQSDIVNGAVGSDLGFPGGVVIAPGDTNRSILYHRIADWTTSGPAEYHMPPLGTFQPNTAGIKLVAEYIASLAPRTNWMVGTNGPAGEPYREFSVENRINDPAPGSPTALDDDFYTSGFYPAGFNGLTNSMTVENDEPSVNWERALTHSDRTNRLHFVTTAGSAVLTLALNRGGAMTNGVALSPVLHSIVVQHRTASQATVLGSYQINGNITLTIPFTAGEGAQTIEVIRTGPTAPNCSYWMLFDSLKIAK